MAIEISTPEQFMAIKDWTDRGTSSALLDVIITQDLDFSGVDNFEGLGETTLYANIDGQGHTIKNIVTDYIKEDDFYVLGVCWGSIKNITIDNCHFTLNNSSQYPPEFSWLYAYQSSKSTCENIVIKNTNRVVNTKGTIRFCTNFTANCIAVGGVYQSGDTITPFNPYSGAVKNSYTACTMICKVGYGFLYGSGYAYNCFARNNVTASKDFYGFGGTNTNNNRVMYCYAANTYTQDMSGSFYGFTRDKNDKCYFDKDIITISKEPTDLDLHGQPTINLKSADWLRTQGWAI